MKTFLREIAQRDTGARNARISATIMMLEAERDKIGQAIGTLKELLA